MREFPKEVVEFLDEVLPSQTAGEIAVHNGDVGPRLESWSHNDPVTVYGVWRLNEGWDGVKDALTKVAQRFSDCTKYEVEVLTAGVSGDLAYTAVYEHTICSVDGVPQPEFTLRVTNVYRREEGRWLLAHRHADRRNPEVQKSE